MKQKGFTLIEMLVVIAMIGTISGITVFNFRAAEKQKRAAIAVDTVINAIRNAQNFTLTGRQINSSICAQGKAPQAYLINFTVAQAMNLWGLDKCDAYYLIESYPYPVNTRVKANGYVLNGGSVPVLKFKFTPPFATVTISIIDGIPNLPPYNSFTTATITVETTDGTVSKSATVNGVSGRIGE